MEKKILAWIDKNYKNGIEIYTDYNDYMEEKTAGKILESEHPSETFYETILKWYDDTSWNYLSDTWKECCKELHIDPNNNDLYEFFQENIYVNYPEDHYLDQDFCVNIVIDNGDANYDFTCHQCYPHYNSRSIQETLQNKSGMAWLARTQGYNLPQFRKIYKEYAKTDDKKKINDIKQQYPFIVSCYDEIANLPSHMGALTFFTRMTLRQLLDWHEHKKTVHINKNIPCGIMDYWSGGGSLLEISLEKDLDIPANKIFRLQVDDCCGPYTVGKTYGMCEDFWK